jgi:two-component system nitrate/nitrite response regulator NarL
MSGKLFNFEAGGHGQVNGLRPGSGKVISTVLACNNPLVCLGLKQLLAGTSFVVSDTAPIEASRLLAAVSPSPDLFIVDGNGPIEQVMLAVGDLTSHYPRARIVLIADTFSLQVLRSGRIAGVDGFCLPANGCEVLIKSLELVMLGEVVLPLSLVDALLSGTSENTELRQSSAEASIKQANPAVRKLSTRETEILGCLSAGEPNKVIARNFGVAEATVKNHLKNILKKIGAANRTQAAIWAKENLLENTEAALHS